jgi:phosphate starvation-inducible PhoH-like protein
MTRREKVAAQRDARFENYLVDRSEPKAGPIPYLNPKNERQEAALEALEADTPFVFLTGSAGTGKSMLAAYRAAKQYRAKKIKKILLVRPNVGAGKTIGLLPGEVEEKLQPHFRQTLTHLEKFLGSDVMEYCLDKKVIEMFPFEYIRGNSFEDCIVILEEVQNFTDEEMEAALTRLGEGCQMIFTGDTKQHDLDGESGLSATINLVNKTLEDDLTRLTDDDLDELESGIAVIHFRPEDVVRRGLTRAIVKMFYYS